MGDSRQGAVLERPLTAAAPLALAERIIALFAEGAFSATYKHALLLALLDLCFEKTSRSGVPPTSVTTRELAEQVLSLYWPQCVPWQTGRYLRQGTGGQAEVLTRIVEFRRDHARTDSQPLTAVRREVPEAFERLVRFVEWKLIEMPIPRLQVLGAHGGPVPLPVPVGRDDPSGRGLGVPEGQAVGLRQHPAAAARGRRGPHRAQRAPASDDSPRVAVARPAVQRRAGDAPRDVPVRPRPRGAAGRARSAERAPGWRLLLLPGTPAAKRHVDHFIPWARYPNNAVENLVVAHERCNLDKKDFLASAAHVARWAEHLDAKAADLAQLAQDTRFTSGAARSLGIAAATYGQLPEESLLWVSGRDFQPIDRPRIQRALRAA